MPNPTLNETTAPYLFDGTVLAGGSNVNYAMAPVAPNNFAYKAWNFHPYFCGGTATVMQVGSVYLAAVNLQYGVTYSNIYVNLLTTGGTAVTGSNFAGIYNAAGTLVAQTADISSVIGTGNSGLLQFPLATALTPAASAQYWVAFTSTANSAGAAPVLLGLAAQTTVGLSNGTLAQTIGGVTGGVTTTGVLPAVAAPYPFTTIGTGLHNTLPATFTAATSTTALAQCFWTGLA